MAVPEEQPEGGAAAVPASSPHKSASSPYKSKVAIPSKPPPIPARLSIETSKLIAFVAESCRSGGPGLLSGSPSPQKSGRGVQSARSAREPELTLQDMGWNQEDKEKKKQLNRRPQSARSKTPRVSPKMNSKDPLHLLLSPTKGKVTKAELDIMEQGWNPSIPVTDRRIPDYNTLPAT